MVTVEVMRLSRNAIHTQHRLRAAGSFSDCPSPVGEFDSGRVVGRPKAIGHMADQRLGLLREIIKLPGQLHRPIEARRRAGNGNGQVLRQTDHRDVQPHLQQWLCG